MTQKHDSFKPDRVDEQVDQLSLNLSGERATGQQQTRESTPKDERIEFQQEARTRFVRELQAYYQIEFQQHQQFLEHAWQQITAHQIAEQALDQAEDASLPLPLLKSSQRIHDMQHQKSMSVPTGKNVAHRVSLFAATLVAVVLVGLLITALTLSHIHQGSNVAISSTTSPTTTPLSFGTIAHTQSFSNMEVDGTAWSPNGTRIASLADYQIINKQTQQPESLSVLQIWDATTGDHLLAIHLGAFFTGISWSPTGKYLALSNYQTILIVDSQTGSTVNTIRSSTAMNRNPLLPTASGGWLSSFFPDGPGGFGFGSVVWTPDGMSLAASIDSSTTTGNIEVLDPLNGAVKETFTAPYASAGITFSSDGQFLAADYANNSYLVVWRVSTQAIVFQQTTGQLSVAWQPGTHNLATEQLAMNPIVNILNIDTQKIVKTYTGITAFSWSPDGKELATFVAPGIPSKSPTNQVTVINATSGAVVGIYKQSSHVQIVRVFWSPSGNHIATLENIMGQSPSGGNTLVEQVIRVWIA